MNRFTILIIVLIPFKLLAQDAKKDSSACKCQHNFQLKYPDIPEQKKLSGTVIVEYEIDSVCIAGKPKIVQSLAPDFDKEALRVINLMIIFENNCNQKCRYHLCEKRKVKFPLTFVNPDDGR